MSFISIASAFETLYYYKNMRVETDLVIDLGPVHMNEDSELPWGNDCPGASITSCSYDDLCSGASSSKSEHHEFI